MEDFSPVVTIMVSVFGSYIPNWFSKMKGIMAETRIELQRIKTLEIQPQRWRGCGIRLLSIAGHGGCDQYCYGKIFATVLKLIFIGGDDGTGNYIIY